MKGRLSKKNVRKNTKNNKSTKNTKNTKNNKRQTKRKTMKMRKTRKDKSQVGGGNMDPELYKTIEKEDGSIPIKLYQLDPEKYWYLKTRIIFQNYIGDQIGNNDQENYENLLVIMDKYKFDKFNELKECMLKILNKEEMSKEDKNNLTNIILILINPNDLSRDITIIEDGKQKAKRLEI